MQHHGANHGGSGEKFEIDSSFVAVDDGETIADNVLWQNESCHSEQRGKS